MSFPAQYATKQSTRRPRRAAEDTRRQIVQTAVTQIADVGFHKMSIANVAAASGISQSGLLHHFPSKAALLTAVLEQREKDDSDFLFGDGSVPMGWDAFDALSSLAARNSTRPEWVGVFVRVAAEATERDHPAHKWLLGHYANARRWLSDALVHGIDAGDIRDDAPVDVIVGNTIALLDGLQQQWLLDPAHVDLVRSVREHVRSLKSLWSTTTTS